MALLVINGENELEHAPFLKTVAILVTLPIRDGPIAKNVCLDMYSWCAKFHAFIIKGT